jgi:hypothetical protein
VACAMANLWQAGLGASTDLIRPTPASKGSPSGAATPGNGKTPSSQGFSAVHDRCPSEIVLRHVAASHCGRCEVSSGDARGPLPAVTVAAGSKLEGSWWPPGPGRVLRRPAGETRTGCARRPREARWRGCGLTLGGHFERRGRSSSAAHRERRLPRRRVAFRGGERNRVY